MISITKNNFNIVLTFTNPAYKNDDLECVNEFENVSSGDSFRNYTDEATQAAKRKVLDYGLNNKWDYFVTLTIDNNKADINNPDYIQKVVCKQFNNYRERYDDSFRYILIPELGSLKGRLHFHGLIHCDDKLENLKYLFYDKKYFTKVYRHEWFFKRLGANQFIETKYQSPAIIRYICKYMNKDVGRVYNRCYFCSKGLNTSEVLIRDHELHLDLIGRLKDVINLDNANITHFQFCDRVELSLDDYDKIKDVIKVFNNTIEFFGG